MYTSRKPYYQLKKSMTEFFTSYSRFIRQSLEKESVAEKPYLSDEYQQMHLDIPGFGWKPRDRKKLPYQPGGAFATGDLKWNWTHIIFGGADCDWDIYRHTPYHCNEGGHTITMCADYFWEQEFNFVANIVKDTTSGATITMLAGEAACAWDCQDFLLTLPEDADGTVTVCGSVTADNALLSVLYKNIAGFYTSLVFDKRRGVFPINKGWSLLGTSGVRLTPVPILMNAEHGSLSANCGCIDISSDCLTCDCTGISIGYTTQQMSVDEEQGLTVTGAVEGCTYDWAIASGGGELSAATGTSVTYTAPASNEDCLQNATITLSVDSGLCDSLQIAINGDPINDSAYWIIGACAEYPWKNDWYCINTRHKCDGVQNGGNIDNGFPTPSVSCIPSLSGYCEHFPLWDIRTAQQKTDGCCPPALM